ncbi:MAG TPA: lipoyl(octanoyl) transferase LipB [Terriglobales bacterium]|nr:lipoyl(octanoyl) transferase LipB [Terriglobales bacterium]
MISVVQLGTLDYATGLRLQQSLVDLRKQEGIGDTLLLLEHSPVITLGRNASRNNLLASQELLAEKGVELFDCDRGGDVTFHGPGQLVGYPIFDLRGFQPKLGAVEFVRRLEEVIIRACADFGVAAQRIAGLTGVWTSGEVPAKIAAIGVHISRGVTSHGFALNVNTDLEYFNLIVPCGITSRPVTSLNKELQRQLALDKIAQSVAQHFGKVFAAEIRWLDTLDALLGRTVGVPLRPPAELRELHEEEIFLA